jgi:hypothetical protein
MQNLSNRNHITDAIEKSTSIQFGTITEYVKNNHEKLDTTDWISNKSYDFQIPIQVVKYVKFPRKSLFSFQFRKEISNFHQTSLETMAGAAFDENWEEFGL